MSIFRTSTGRMVCGLVVMLLLVNPVLADVTYTVQPGDSLSKLAARFAIPLEELISRNQIKDPEKLYAGQRLKLPDSVAVDEAGAEQETTAESTEATAATPDASTAPDESAAPEQEDRSLTGRQLYEERAKLLNEQKRRQGESLVVAARSLAGTPYRWGGITSRGIDCSGLVVRAMLMQGKQVPHRAAALYKMGVPVTYSELQAGDLVFFNTMGGGVSHVGIWVGENKFIHASSGQGRVVVSEMVGYYSKRLVGARRLR